jgi:copper chaperone
MTTETIHVPEIHCGHCKSAIEGTLNPLDGISRAEVSVDEHTVTVEYDDRAIGRGRIVDELVELGYDVPA